MNMIKAVQFLERIFFKPSRWLGYLGMSTVLLLIFFTVSDSLLRNLLNRSIVGTHELIEFTMAILVFFSLAYTEIEKRHVSIDILYNRLPQRAQAIFHSLAVFFSLTIFSLITWQTLLYGIEMWQSRTISPTLNIPIYPFVFVVAFGTGMLCAVLFVNFLHSLTKGRGR
jgi:TRAP-type C4-dicarboxylate transport system permease small subunit